jgi:hypothetical protein
VPSGFTSSPNGSLLSIYLAAFGRLHLRHPLQHPAVSTSLAVAGTACTLCSALGYGKRHNAGQDRASVDHLEPASALRVQTAIPQRRTLRLQLLDHLLRP